jgi:hypothetical protein
MSISKDILDMKQANYNNGSNPNMSHYLMPAEMRYGV